MDLNELTRQLQLLLDLEAIKTLKHQYCAFCDDNYNPESIAGLFVEEGTWDGGDFGRHLGRDAIRKFFQNAPKTLSFAAHQVMNPILKINGDSATGEWKLLQPCTVETRNGPRAMWLAANYHDTYVRTAAGWKFQSLKVTSLFFTPHEDGWVKTRFLPR
jgi:hypothetical protein